MEAQHRCAALVGRHAHISRFQSERIKRWKSNRWLPRPHRQTAKLLTWILAKSKWCLCAIILFLGMAQNDWYPKWDALTSRHRFSGPASVPWPRQTELLTCGDAEISGCRDLCPGWVQMPPDWPKNLPTQQSSWALSQPVLKKRFPPLLKIQGFSPLLTNWHFFVGLKYVNACRITAGPIREALFAFVAMNRVS